MKDGLFDERKCCICGRSFLPAPFHVYHKGARWCCTYGCYLKLQANMDVKKNKTDKKGEQNERQID